MTGRSRKVWRWAAVTALLALHFTLAVVSKLHESTTSDELVHLTGGYTYWRFDDYRLHPENGNLAQRWVALPVWIKGSKFPDLNQPYWKTSDAWVMGHEFFYETGEDHFPKLMVARAMTALFSVGIGLLVFCWSRRLFGTAGGFLSLVFFVFSPTFLAHGGYATSDVCMGLFMLGAVGAWWRHLQRPGGGPFWVSAVVFGLACVAKFSAPLIPLMMLLCAAAHIGSARGQTLRVLRSALGHAVVAYAVIWTFYGLRYSAFNPALPPADQFIEAWPLLYADHGYVMRSIHLLADYHFLPEAFLYGAAYVVENAKQRAAFLNGEYSTFGWRSFFVWSFVLKSTIPFLAASALSVWVGVRARLKPNPAGPARLRGLLAFTPLFAVFSVYWIFSLSSHLNIGHRHLIPIYPVLFILLGSLGHWLTRPPGWRPLLVVLLLTWHVGESLWIAPHYLAYFNELEGGPAHGASHLVDSSLDWGQDLPGLQSWLTQNHKPGETAYLAYFGTGEPRYYHLPVKRLVYINGFHEDEPYVPLGPGLYCIGATALEQVYSAVTGPWTGELEKEYQYLRIFEPIFREYAEDPAVRAKLEHELAPQKWTASRDRFLQLRFARLCYYLRVRRPEAVIGYSIFIYRLNADEVRAATAGSLRDWSSLIERSADGTDGR